MAESKSESDFMIMMFFYSFILVYFRIGLFAELKHHDAAAPHFGSRSGMLSGHIARAPEFHIITGFPSPRTVARGMHGRSGASFGIREIVGTVVEHSAAVKVLGYPLEYLTAGGRGAECILAGMTHKHHA